MKAVLAVLLIIAGGTGYYFFFHPPVLLKRATQASLTQFSDAVATRDRAKISAALDKLLAADAKVRLEVNFFSLSGQGRPAITQDFDKQQFITFIDNTLYPLTDYAYYATLKNFTLAGNRESATLQFTSKEWADGTSYYGGIGVMSRFSSETVCDGKAVFADPHMPQLAEARCVMQFRSVPKPGEAQKLQNMDSIRDMLLEKR